MNVEQWYDSRFPRGEARSYLIDLRDGGFLTPGMLPTRKGIDAGEAVLRLIEQHRPGATEEGEMLDVLEVAEEVLHELDPNTPRAQRGRMLLLFGLTIESVAAQHVERVEFGRRVGRKIS